MGIFDLMKKKNELAALRKEMSEEEFWALELRRVDVAITELLSEVDIILEILVEGGFAVPDVPSLKLLKGDSTPETETEEEEVHKYDFPGRGPVDATVAFVGVSPGQIDGIRKRPLSGVIGKTFEELYLPFLGLGIDDVYITNIVKEHCTNDAGKGVDPTSEQISEAWDDFAQEIKEVNPRFIVALGKAARDALGDAAEEHVPHPRAININHDSGEIKRKLTRLARAIDKPDYVIEGSVIKSEDEKQIVYSIVMEPFENDTDENWTTPQQIEDAAHHFMKNFRLIDSEHNRLDIDAVPVESWLTHEDTVIGGQEVKAGSWVMGTKVESAEDWEKVKDGTWSGFSIDATAHIDPNLLLRQ